MKRNVTAILALCAVMTVSAAPKRLASIMQVEDGDVPSTPEEELLMTTRYIYGQDGKLQQVKDGSTTVTLAYDAADPKKMTITVDDPDDALYETYDITLDDAGNAIAASRVEANESTNVTFEYTDGYLTCVTKVEKEYSYSDTETFRFTYANGNISRIDCTYSGGASFTDISEFTYTGISNPGKLQMFDSMYGLDLDELEYLGPAGHLGTACAELPTGVKFIDETETETGTVQWTLDNEGYPTRLNAVGNTRDYVVFTWETPAGVGQIGAAADSEAAIYTLQGVRTEKPGKGIYIVRHADGRCEKHIR